MKKLEAIIKPFKREGKDALNEAASKGSPSTSEGCGRQKGNRALPRRRYVVELPAQGEDRVVRKTAGERAVEASAGAHTGRIGDGRFVTRSKRRSGSGPATLRRRGMSSAVHPRAALTLIAQRGKIGFACYPIFRPWLTTGNM